MAINQQINQASYLCEEIIYSNEYTEEIINFLGNIEYIRERYRPDCIQVFTDRGAVIYRKRSEREVSIQTLGYAALPKVYGLLEENGNRAVRTEKKESITAASVLRLQQQTSYDLTGQGVLVGFVDTGIDYQNPLFRYADGTSRIQKLWDQTIPYFSEERQQPGEHKGSLPEEYLYGTVFSKEELEQTMSGIPLSEDLVGHGTAMAAIAAGNREPADNFTGIAYLADLLVVKLKPAKEYLKEYYGIAPDVLCYAETDLIMGVSYLLRQAQILGKPIILCLGIGTNMGGHDGLMPLAAYLTNQGDFPGVGIVAAGGNETNRRHHYRSGEFLPGRFEEVEFNVAERENGFTLELWAKTPALFSAGVIAPTGAAFEKVPIRQGVTETIRFLPEPAVVKVDYEQNEGQTGDELIVFRFFAPTAGIWRIRVYNEGRNAAGYDLWLPLTGFIREETAFLRPDPQITVCDPANARRVLVSGAYDHIGGGIYPYSSRGYVRSREERIVPTLCSPGVEIDVPVGRQGEQVRYGRRSGTSIAAAHAAGACALLMEWGFVKGNDLDMDTNALMQYLIRGADRNSQINYPNRIWGWGTLNLLDAFEGL